MLKKSLKIFIIAIVYLIFFVISNIFMPYSSEFKQTMENTPPIAAIYIFFYCLYISFVIYLIVKNSVSNKLSTVLKLGFYIFLMQGVMTQVETFFFKASFNSITNTDIVLIVMAGFPSAFASSFAGVKLFFNIDQVQVVQENNYRDVVFKVLLLGLIYATIYFVFGFFVAWQFEATRIFYSGNPEKLSFAATLLTNLNEDASIFPFQVMRGVFFGGIVFLLYTMLNKKPDIFVISNILGCCMIGVSLIIPNPLFPDQVRFAHFLELMSSMALFGFLSARIFLGMFL